MTLDVHDKAIVIITIIQLRKKLLLVNSYNSRLHLSNSQSPRQPRLLGYISIESYITFLQDRVL